MYYQLAFAAIAVVFGNDFVSAQELIPSTTTAAELWNPWTWFWPYAIATAEGYRDYYQKAQKATNELYMQIEKTNAFPWLTGNWGSPQNNQNGQNNQNNQNGQKPQDNQNGQNNQNNQSGQNNQTQNTKPTENNQAENTKPTENNQTEGTKPTENDQGKGEEATTGGNQSKPGLNAQAGAQGDGNADAGVSGST